jgi:ADP-ribose pyrophosphatase
MSRRTNDRGRVVLKSGKWLRLVREVGWEYVERVKASGVVAIVAVTDAGELLLTEQYRPAVGACVIDLPAGLAGDIEGAEAETLATAAQRELIEETGYDARRFERLATAATTPGLTSERVTLFRAVGLKCVGPGGGIDGEDIKTHCIKLRTIEAWLRKQARAGMQIDLKIYAALHFAGRLKHDMR